MKKLIVALDVNDEKKALDLIETLAPYVDIFKVGPILFLKTGPSLIKRIQDAGKKVFLDLKFHDIPQTVKRAVQSAAEMGVYSATLHSSGGPDMLKAACEVQDRPKLWAITVLTSQQASADHVNERAVFAKECGVDGVIASPLEVKDIKKSCGAAFEVVTPGIRLAETHDDQKRVATPLAAIKAGADFIVVGRPIIEAVDPAAVAKKISEEIHGI